MSVSVKNAVNAVNSNRSVGVSKPRGELKVEVLVTQAVDSELRERMFFLYQRYYADTSASLFEADFSGKTHVVVMHDESGVLVGFSTIECYRRSICGRNLRVMFSGDTIVDRSCWGSSRLASTWLAFAGHLYREGPDPLFWLLIVKGHRTYRFLSAFARQYLPHHELVPSPSDVEIRDRLAKEKFGECYDPRTGIVHFATPKGRLREPFADVPDNHRRLDAVAYFLASNPKYRDGDELVCLCALAPGNLKPMAQRIFAGPITD